MSFPTKVVEVTAYWAPAGQYEVTIAVNIPPMPYPLVDPAYVPSCDFAHVTWEMCWAHYAATEPLHVEQRAIIETLFQELRLPTEAEQRRLDEITRQLLLLGAEFARPSAKVH